MGTPIGSVGPSTVSRYSSYVAPPPVQQQAPTTWVSPFEQSSFTPSPAAPAVRTDAKTGLIKSGTVRPDQNGMLNLPGVGLVDTKTLKGTVKIPGTKYKYKIKRNADGSYSVKLKKPGFFSKLGGFFKKALSMVQPFLNLIPGVGPILSQAVGMFMPR